MRRKTTESTLDSLVRLRSKSRRIALDDQTKPEEVRAKVIEDINFLRGRIDHIKRSSFVSPSSSILSTYESLLESRESLLSWLSEHQGASEAVIEQRYKASS